jgi:hypothetical protein
MVPRLHAALPAAFLTLALTGCATPGSDPLAGRTALIGAPAADQPAVQRTVTITPDTQFVNVTSGETVRFVLGTRSFAWSFQSGPTVSKFDLNLIAPPGMLAHPVTVYVAANPTYISNS